MAEQRVAFLAWNRGLISKYALARVDLQRMHMSALVQRNWLPRVFGSMMLRPGLGYTGIGPYNNAVSKSVAFVRSTDIVARLEFTDSVLRVLIGDAPVTRPAVTAAIANGTFNTGLASWTDADESGATSAWASPGYMSLSGTGFNSAIRKQTVTVNQANVEHALRIVVARGPVVLRVGSADDGDDYIAQTALGPGTHSLAFTPTGASFYIRLSNREQFASLVDSIAVEGAGVMTLPTPWPEGQLQYLRTDQSADVVYVCDGEVQQRKIERRATRSWSIVLYQPEDGPFLIINASTVTLTPSDTKGDITLAASDRVFRASHVGALFRLSSTSQDVTAALSGDGQYSDPIRVTGIAGKDGTRGFNITVAGTWTGTLALQQSIAEPGAWHTVKTYGGNGTVVYTDGLDNQIAYYRLGFDGAYGSGTANVELQFSGGSIDGIVRITSVTDGENAAGTVLQSLGDTNATSLWYDGAWSDYRGWPSSVRLHEGRLWWMGYNKYFGSVSDGYESFDDTTQGDSGPVQRSIGKGPVDKISWALSLQRLLVGTDGSEISARSDSFDTPLTPTNFNLKFPSTQGSARVAAVQIDNDGYFVQRSGTRLFELSWAVGQSLDYASSDLTAVCYEVGKPGISLLAVQRQPDTRLHCLRTDGTVAVAILDKLEDVKCWIEFETDGVVEDICILPGMVEDEVYYTVARTVNGSTVRYYEKFAMESECRGGTLNKQADCFVTYSGAATNTIAGLGHLEGRGVIVWADGMDLSPGSGTAQKTYRVTGSAIALDSGVAVSNAVIGLPYQADFESVKLAYAAQLGSALAQQKKIGTLAVLAADMHYQGLQYGRNLTDPMDDLPLIVQGVATPPNTVWADFDDTDFTFPGEWGPDERLCLRANAPRPCNLLAAVVRLETNDTR